MSSNISFDDNVIQRFQLDVSNLRGRSLRLGSVLDDILSAHDYPAPVAHLVGETIALALLLSSMLKYDGVFTLQTKGDGPVGMIVADVSAPDNVVRGCASFDPERLEQARVQLAALKTVEASQNHLAQYLGKGYIAFTVDQPGSEESFQGIVDLHGSSLVDCVQHYFQQSEQIKSGIKMAVGQRGGRWRAGGIMLQLMPEDEAVSRAGETNIEEDDWRRAMILMDTCTDDEFLDEELHSNIVLTRLFHEEGVRVFDPLSVQKGCRCSLERVEGMVGMMPEDEIEYLRDEAESIPFVCEFCSTEYLLNSKDIARIRKGE